MTKFQNISLLFFTVLLVTSKVSAQDSSEANSTIWIDLSAGLVGMKDMGTTLSGELRWQDGAQLITAQVIYSKEFTLDLPIIPDQQASPRERVSMVGILYGRTHSFHLRRMLFPFFPFAIFIKQEADYSISGSIGVAAFDNLFRSDKVKETAGFEGTNKYFEEKSFVVGIPVQVEIVQIFSPEVGYVHRLFYHWNNKRESWGFQWGIQVYL